MVHGTRCMVHGEKIHACCTSFTAYRSPRTAHPVPKSYLRIFFHQKIVYLVADFLPTDKDQSFTPDFVRAYFFRCNTAFRFKRNPEVAHFADLNSEPQGQVLGNGFEQIINTGSGFLKGERSVNLIPF